MASSYDIGTGRITGFFTGGRAELLPILERTLSVVKGLGPFVSVNAPIVGTDNYDFMMQGVPNLVANQESANYGPNYHARSDEFGRADLRQLRLNAAVAAAVTWGFATTERGASSADGAAGGLAGSRHRSRRPDAKLRRLGCVGGREAGEAALGAPSSRCYGRPARDALCTHAREVCHGSP